MTTQTVKSCPPPDHDWPLFETWCEHGRLPKERPARLRRAVPTAWFDCYRHLHPVLPKPVLLSFVPPVAFYRTPNDSTIGITEMLDVWKGDIAIDPLAAGTSAEWIEFVNACRARARNVYGWSRLGSRNRAWHFGQACSGLAITRTFPNIEDDDLRAAAPDVDGFLTYVATVCPTPVGVLTNYNVSDLWPKGNALAHLAVLPEWFPREITDPTATLEGSLDSGRRHFAAALPALDGRESGLAAFPYPAGAYCVWPADNVTSWEGWVR